MSAIMGSERWYLSIFGFLTTIVGLADSQPSFIQFFCSNDVGNYTQNSTYQTNLNTLRSSLSSNISPYGFYNSSVGEDPDRVYAIALCRGDVSPQGCQDCVNDSINEIMEVCPNQKEAIGWYARCMFRYSSKNILHNMTTKPSTNTQSSKVPANVSLYLKQLSNLTNTLRDQTVGGSSLLKFASGISKNDNNVQTIYAYMQCTPNLDARDCNLCLEWALKNMTQCCHGKDGARVIGPSCSYWYEGFPFLNENVSQPPPPPPPPQSQTPAPPQKGKDESKTTMIIINVISTVFLLILAFGIFICRRKWQNWWNCTCTNLDEIEKVEAVHYDFKVIKAATNNFSDANLLGKGGFGAVYKGTLSDGKEIAVKRLSKNSGQGQIEFKNEVLLVTKLQHKSLVRLLGFCMKQTERLLVYEFMSNGSLDQVLFDPVKRLLLPWDLRYKIIESVAKGLLYLHGDSQVKIIHRDLKPSNILLDKTMTAKISDFGMAKLFQDDESVANTNRIVGTYGYMAPEYALRGLVSNKSDVFSYGVLILEIISGRKNYYFRLGQNEEDLLSYAWKNWLRGTASNIIDSSLQVDSDSMQTILRCIHIGLLCVQDNASSRPSMNFAVLMLHSFSTSLPLPSEPAYITGSGSIASDEPLPLEGSKTRCSNQIQRPAAIQSLNEVTISELDPR